MVSGRETRGFIEMFHRSQGLPLRPLSGEAEALLLADDDPFKDRKGCLPAPDQRQQLLFLN